MSSAPIKSSAGKSPAGHVSVGNARRYFGLNTSGVPSAGGPLPRNRYLIYFGLATIGCGLDLLTKEAVFRWRGPPRPDNEWWLIHQRFGFETSFNPGALFGMGAGWWWLFALLSVVALAGITTWLFVYRAAWDRWITVALGFVSGGILGNLYDRIVYHSVRDWILFRWEESGLAMFKPWPNFNIADSLLVTGAIMLVVHAVVWRDVSEMESKSSKETSKLA